MATIQLPPDFKEFLRLLTSSRVEYLVIGGYAVNYYGFARATADLDIWIAIDPVNAERVAEVLRQFGFLQAAAAAFLEALRLVQKCLGPVPDVWLRGIRRQFGPRGRQSPRVAACR